MLPKGLIIAISLGIISGPLFGIFLYEFAIEEQLIYVEGTSLSIVTEKTDFKLGESITIKIVNSGTNELKYAYAINSWPSQPKKTVRLCAYRWKL